MYPISLSSHITRSLSIRRDQQVLRHDHLLAVLHPVSVHKVEQGLEHPRLEDR
jgi:hypothetical protein